SDIQDFQQRLQLVQQGAERILPPATAVSHIVKDVRQLLQAGNAARRVVIVDDDPEVLEFVTTILAPWGFQLTALERPTQLWQTLDKLRPDLLILDVEMPEASGLELCQVLRADDRWRHLPILFLTAHEDINTQQQAFNVGADDFVSKATMAADLPGRILNRLKRTQL
ncbi:MAG: response regulator, partial [Cyanobacteria bacterium P01_D01_bin.14]